MARARDAIPDRPRGKDLRSLRPVLAFLRPYRRQMIYAAIGLVIAASSVLLLGQGLRAVIDHGLAAADPRGLDQMLLALLVLVSVLAAATYNRFYWVSWIGERVSADLRRAVFNHLLTLEPSFFEVTRTGEVVSRLTNDTALLEVVIGSSISLAVRNLLLLVGSFVMLLATSARLTTLVLLCIPLVVAPILILGRRVRTHARATQDRVAGLAVSIDETLHEVRTVQAWGHEPVDRLAFGTQVEDVFATALRRIRLRATLVGLVMLLSFAAVGVILWIGGHDVLAGRISAGDLSAFVFYAVLMAGAVGAVSEVIGDLQRAAGASERLGELLATRPGLSVPIDPERLPDPPQGRLEFTGVRFAYPSRPEELALARFTLRVERGERVALVGPSGAGKSTVFQLLLRFHDPQTGVIRVDGVPIPRADPRQIRERFALVPQDPVIFATSVIENVRYGRPQASAAQVREACAAAQAMEFIERLPQGLDTFLGERGVRLSGGERQRIAIARALLADRPILLLDEATSALDAASEVHVQRALEALARGRTSLVIAHRLATVQRADRIIVLERGRIVGEGTHDTLMREGGLYAELATLQFLSPAGAGGAGDATSAGTAANGLA